MRQFISAKTPDSRGFLEITQKDFHYLRSVLRMMPGDMISVSAPGGMTFSMTVCKVDDNGKKIILQRCDLAGAEDSGGDNEDSSDINGISYTLLQFIPKPQKMELIVRQATECGVKTIIPVIGEYTQGGMEKTLQKTDRFIRIIREARQQSGSKVDTQILPPCSLERAVEIFREENAGREKCAALVLYERNDKSVSLKEALAPIAEKDKTRACAIAVGSEGGISAGEFESLLSKGFSAVHFKTNILRCETAALYGIAAVQNGAATD